MHDGHVPGHGVYVADCADVFVSEAIAGKGKSGKGKSGSTQCAFLLTHWHQQYPLQGKIATQLLLLLSLRRHKECVSKNLIWQNQCCTASHANIMARLPQSSPLLN
jgi:hypothetical protein